jgi:hypothetical protein
MSDGNYSLNGNGRLPTDVQQRGVVPGVVPAEATAARQRRRETVLGF